MPLREVPPFGPICRYFMCLTSPRSGYEGMRREAANREFAPVARSEPRWEGLDDAREPTVGSGAAAEPGATARPRADQCQDGAELRRTQLPEPGSGDQAAAGSRGPGLGGDRKDAAAATTAVTGNFSGSRAPEDSALGALGMPQGIVVAGGPAAFGSPPPEKKGTRGCWGLRDASPSCPRRFPAGPAPSSSSLIAQANVNGS